MPATGTNRPPRSTFRQVATALAVVLTAVGVFAATLSFLAACKSTNH